MHQVAEVNPFPLEPDPGMLRGEVFSRLTISLFQMVIKCSLVGMRDTVSTRLPEDVYDFRNGECWLKTCDHFTRVTLSR